MKVKSKMSSHCKQLRLPAIGERVQQMADQASASGISYLEFAENLLEVEVKYRNHKDQERKIKTARLPRNYDLQAYDCSLVEGMPLARLGQLKELTWLDQNFNLIIMGPNGKSWLGCALGYQACLLGIKTRYFNMNRLIEAISMAKTEGSYLRFLNGLEKVPLIIIDDFGLQSLNKNMKLALLQIMEDRYAKKSLIVTSQLPVAKWHEYLDEPTLADYPHFLIMRSG